MKRIATLLMLIMLNGCVAVWGKPYNVDSASSASITITYDPALTNTDVLQSVAEQNCDKYGKDAVPFSARSPGFALMIISYQCVPRR